MHLRQLVVLLVGGVALTATAATAGAQVGTKHAATITFWSAYSSDGPEVKTLEKVIIPGFEKTHPGVTVKDVTIPYDSLHQKLVTAVAGGQLPDLVRSDIIWVPELAKLGVLQPLDTTMPDFKKYAGGSVFVGYKKKKVNGKLRKVKVFKKYAGTVFPGPLATNFWHGHYYGLPLDTNTRIFNYNPAALQAIGATAPPKNFAQLKSMSAQAKAHGYYLYAESGTSCWNVCPWIWSNGGSITNKTYTKATGYLNGPKSVAAIQMLVNLFKAG